MSEESTPRRLGVLAAYKVSIGLALCALALELHHLLGRDLAEWTHQLVLHLHADPHNPLIVAATRRAVEVDSASLGGYAVVAAVFGNVHLIEGIGLWFRKHWAEYFCVISTALLIPLELYEVIKKPHPLPILMLAVNIAVVWFLVCRIRRGDPAPPRRPTVPDGVA